MSTDYRVYVGTYTHGKSEGIYRYRFSLQTGTLSYEGVTTGIQNPSFLTIHPQGRYLYSVSETGDFDGKPGGAVSAFQIDPETGALRFLNHQSSEGAGPCHVSVDQTGRYVLVANYSGGSVAMLPIREDGSLAPASDLVQHEGASVNPSRQEGPHAHSIHVSPDNRFALAPDLGLDKILIYRLDLERGRLVPNDPPYAQVTPGAGPRHFTFHPNGRYAYVINELGNTVTAFAYEAETGTLTAIQEIATLPDDFEDTSYCADIHITPCGRTLYGSNRGHDSLAIFRIDEETGRLTPLGYESTQGKFPRNFAIDPTGRYILAANQNSDSVVVYRIQEDSGLLEPTGHVVEIPTPVCLQFLAIA